MSYSTANECFTLYKANEVTKKVFKEIEDLKGSALKTARLPLIKLIKDLELALNEKTVATLLAYSENLIARSNTE